VTTTVDFRWLAEFGLACDFFGALVIACDLIVPKKKAIELSRSLYSSNVDEENLKLPQVKDRLKQSRNAIIGVTFLVIGFTLQLFGNWPR